MKGFVGLPIAFRQASSPDTYDVFFSWKRIGFADLACSQKNQIPLPLHLS
jgi:hypothetical protein